MTYPVSLVVIAPAALKAQAEALGNALGWSGENLTIPFSADGSAPATHYGCHAWARAEQAALFTGEADPPSLPEGVTLAQLNAIRAQLIVSARTEEPTKAAHVEQVAQANAIQRVEQA